MKEAGCYLREEQRKQNYLRKYLKENITGGRNDRSKIFQRLQA